MTQQTPTYEVTDKVLTLPNVLSFVRLCFVPLFLYLLLTGSNLAATLVFAFAASTDWVDGQVARRTNQVSKLGQLLDPAVDRILMISGVVGLLLVGRLPLWIVVFVLARDLLLLGGGSVLLHRFRRRVDVVFAGKLATTLLYVGFAGILLNWPLLSGLGWVDVSWLPLFNDDACSWGFIFAYAGLVLSVFTTIHYLKTGMKMMRQAQEEQRRHPSLNGTATLSTDADAGPDSAGREA